ncbi:hypothetical protein CCACVL1_12922, partial [Corchorus capsularis]
MGSFQPIPECSGFPTHGQSFQVSDPGFPTHGQSFRVSDPAKARMAFDPPEWAVS